jgi:hypothetical protein
MRSRHTREGGYPVRCGFAISSRTPRNTGSPAFAGDDSRECGTRIRDEFYGFTSQTANNASIVEPSLRANGSRECAPDDRLREAIHSRKERMDCFVATLLAMTAIPDTHLRSRGAKRPRRCLALPPSEGVGNAGCPWHPRPRVHLVVVERTRVTTSTPESPDVPARNGFNGFLRALPGDRALLPPSSAD